MTDPNDIKDLTLAADDLAQQHLRENKDAADRSTAAAYDDLLGEYLDETRDTRRARVGELVEQIRSRARAAHVHGNSFMADDFHKYANLLETLSAENKALRESLSDYVGADHEPDCRKRVYDRSSSPCTCGYENAIKLMLTEDLGQPDIAYYDKRSHVAVPRELMRVFELEAAEGFDVTIRWQVFNRIHTAMLSAQEGE